MQQPTRCFYRVSVHMLYTVVSSHQVIVPSPWRSPQCSWRSLLLFWVSHFCHRVQTVSGRQCPWDHSFRQICWKYGEPYILITLSIAYELTLIESGYSDSSSSLQYSTVMLLSSSYNFLSFLALFSWVFSRGSTNNTALCIVNYWFLWEMGSESNSGLMLSR